MRWRDDNPAAQIAEAAALGLADFEGAAVGADELVEALLAVVVGVVGGVLGLSGRLDYLRLDIANDIYL